MALVVNKVDRIKLSLQESTVYYSVPLHIQVEKEFMLGDVVAEGDIVLDFQTDFEINADWTIYTDTQIVDFTWLIEPKAEVLGLKIPVTTVAERVLNSSKETVSDAIDNQVKESLGLKEYALQAWDLVQAPTLVSEEYETRLKFTPRSLTLSPFKTETDRIISTLSIRGNTQMSVGPHYQFLPNTPLSSIEIKDLATKEGFKMNILAEIPLEAAEKVTIKNLKGEFFFFGKRKIVVEALKFRKEEEAIVIEVQTSGNYSGGVVLKGIPVYDADTNQISIKILTFNLDTKNFMLKWLKCLFNGLITRRLEKYMVYPLTTDIVDIQAQLHKQLADFEVQEGVFLKGKVKTLKVNRIFLEKNTIRIDLYLEGAVRILVDKL